MIGPPGASHLENTIEDPWDRAEEYTCVKCKELFSSIKDKVPYMLPCQHNACGVCILKGEDGRKEFVCPIDFVIIDGIHMAERNSSLFQKVKERERHLALKHEAE